MVKCHEFDSLYQLIVNPARHWLIS